jgi:hypothetical protein
MPYTYMKCMVLTVVPVNIIVFWDVIPPSLVETVLCFGRICYLYLHYPHPTSTTTTTTATQSLFTYQTKKFTVHTTDTLFFSAVQIFFSNALVFITNFSLWVGFQCRHLLSHCLNLAAVKGYFICSGQIYIWSTERNKFVMLRKF